MDEKTFRNILQEELSNFVTKEDAKQFVTKKDLKNFLTKEEAKQFATKQDLLHLKKDICEEIGDQIRELIEALDSLKADKIMVLSHEHRITKLEEKIHQN